MLQEVSSRKDIGRGHHDAKWDMSILERINASTPSWRGWNLHLNDFGFLLNIPHLRVSKRRL